MVSKRGTIGRELDGIAVGIGVLPLYIGNDHCYRNRGCIGLCDTKLYKATAAYYV
ncbi:unnamed protein product [Dovyalis caffra]|uniref:Uncharacterized protein n=1 Tax=Dovyalis caffra TaxID=77055 RepID=A0AAV1SGW3_9ROSI|nr:unnamed protein product [Dovyalis caffra]